jgi:hypothetical protein
MTMKKSNQNTKLRFSENSPRITPGPKKYSASIINSLIVSRLKSKLERDNCSSSLLIMARDILFQEDTQLGRTILATKTTFTFLTN